MSKDASPFQVIRTVGLKGGELRTSWTLEEGSEELGVSPFGLRAAGMPIEEKRSHWRRLF